MPTRTEAIKLFLTKLTKPDLADLYNFNMECQVNVAQDGGERVEGEFKGRRWNGWTDGLTTWKPFRIPWNANTQASYNDSNISFELDKHAEGIGMTGWDWKNNLSRWCAFDFDAITGHSDKHTSKLTPEQMEAVKQAAMKIDWVTVRKSTSGKGLHLYVALNPPVPTANHTEHAALARAILGSMSALTGFDFKSSVDNCGGNMWVWHRKMKGTDGLSILKSGIPLTEPPINWRDHINVTSGKKKRNVPEFISKNNVDEDFFDELCGKTNVVPLDADHQKLLTYLSEKQCLWWWDQERHMLVCHTSDLMDAHKDLNMRGIFSTAATGKEKGADQNCFCFPMRRGAWNVRRHTQGVQESSTWEQDGSGWTRCFLNREPDLRTAARAFGGVENEKGGFVFRETETAIQAAAALGASLDVPARIRGREAVLSTHKTDGRLVIKVKHEGSDDNITDWLVEKDKFVKILPVQTSNPVEPDLANFDDLVRHLVTETGDDYGWLLKSEGKWRNEPLKHVQLALEAMGYTPPEVKEISGSSVLKCWALVNKPFQAEYPGNREWNRDAAQLRFAPSQNEQLNYPTWNKLLNHCGAGLDDTIKNDGWCKANGILTGSDYLKCWLASLFQEPLAPLPYLFFYSQQQNTGKSSFHEAVDLLMVRGYRRAENALTSQSGFNGELENAIVCVVEEIDVKTNKQAYARIKDWVTSKYLNIRHLYQTPYHVQNTTHWIQCANNHNACPMFPGDTRITMISVPPLDPLELVPKKNFMQALEKEAPDFIAELLKLELPESNDRLNVPVINTSEKLSVESTNQNSVEAFISEYCYKISGHSVKFSDFCDKFFEFLDPSEVAMWTKIKVGRMLPPEIPKGRASWDNSNFHLGNISFEPQEAKQGKFVLSQDGFLRYA